MNHPTQLGVGDSVTLFQISGFELFKLYVAAFIRWLNFRRFLLSLFLAWACVTAISTSMPSSDLSALGSFPIRQPYIFSGFKPKSEKDKAVVAFVKRFAPTAKEEAKKYGQPASVKLAQAILESDAGRSRLVKKAGNYFGKKCFSRNCKKGHCINFGDDSHKDFFLKFGTAWESFRAHSKLVSKSGRYADCHKTKDPFKWCECLKKKGYATDKDYAPKLKDTIRRYHLEEFDL